MRPGLFLAVPVHGAFVVRDAVRCTGVGCRVPHEAGEQRQRRNEPAPAPVRTTPGIDPEREPRVSKILRAVVEQYIAARIERAGPIDAAPADLMKLLRGLKGDVVDIVCRTKNERDRLADIFRNKGIKLSEQRVRLRRRLPGLRELLLQQQVRLLPERRRLPGFAQQHHS